MIERDIPGKKRGFWFNFYAFSIVEEKLGRPIDEILKDLNPEDGKPRKPTTKIICTFFYAGAVNYCEKKDQPIDFKINDMGDWIEDLGFEDAMSIISTSLKVDKPKNIQPPQPEGEKVGA